VSNPYYRALEELRDALRNGAVLIRAPFILAVKMVKSTVWRY